MTLRQQRLGELLVQNDFDGSGLGAEQHSGGAVPLFDGQYGHSVDAVFAGCLPGEVLRGLGGFLARARARCAVMCDGGCRAGNKRNRGRSDRPAGTVFEDVPNGHAASTPVEEELMRAVTLHGRRNVAVDTVRLRLSVAPQAYQTFQKKADGMVKVVLKP